MTGGADELRKRRVEALLTWLNHGGVAVFAASGALTASREQLDILGFCLVAAVTGIGSVAKIAVGRGGLRLGANQAATWNSSATKPACARMSRPPMRRTCPFLTILGQDTIWKAPRAKPVSHSRKETDTTRVVDLHELADLVPPSSKVALPTEFAGVWRAMIRA